MQVRRIMAAHARQVSGGFRVCVVDAFGNKWLHEKLTYVFEAQRLATRVSARGEIRVAHWSPYLNEDF